MSIILLKSYFETSYIDTVFCIKIGIITLITWGPIQIAYLSMEYMYPSENARIMENMRYEDDGY